MKHAAQRTDGAKWFILNLLSMLLCVSSLAHAFASPQRSPRYSDQIQGCKKSLQQFSDISPSAPAVMSLTDEPCIITNTIRLKGSTLIPTARQSELLKPFENRCLHSGQLKSLLKAITQYYIDSGHVASFDYSQQRHSACCELVIVVVEGLLERVDSSTIASDRELAMSFPGEFGQPLNLRELEQLEDQINRLPSRAAELKLIPGAEMRGSRAQLEGVRTKPWRVSLSRHNEGDVSTGEQQWEIGFDWDSPLGLADQLSLFGGLDAVSDELRHSDSQSIYYRLPYGWWTFSYSFDQSYSRSRAEGAGFAFKMDSESTTHLLRAERLLVRTTESNTSVNFGLSNLRTRDYFDDYFDNALSGISDQRLPEIQLGFSRDQNIGTASVYADIGWQHGVGGGRDPLPGEPVANYNKYSLTLSYLQPIQFGGESFSFDTLASGQWSEDVLYSPLLISVGGITSVRGFKEQSLSGDSGGYLRNQLRWSRPVTIALLQPYLQQYGITFAYDLGVIHGDSYNSEFRGRLSGNAFEFSVSGQHLAASLTLARSLEQPAVIQNREHPLYFRFSLLF